ncbi:MAG: hypothetical protein AB1458_12160 [Bacteroidota bacterium]
MIKYLLLLFNMLGVLLFRGFFAEDISVTQTAPAKVNPGEEFTVEITVKKGSLAGFAQIKSELPEGMTAAVADAGGAEFKFSGQIVRFTWTSLPSSPEFKVSYKVSVAATVQGIKPLTGKFSYVLNNQKSSIELNPLEIQVGSVTTENLDNQTTTNTTTTTPPDNTTTTTTTNTTPPDNTGDNTAPPDNTNKTAEPVNVTASRKFPKEGKPGDEFTVEVTIFKGALKGFARFQDVMPDGFIASAGESKGGTFSFQDQKAKIVWDNVPADESFTITYKVRLESSAAGEHQIEGLFSYVENDEPKKITLTPSVITVKKEETLVNTTPDNTNNTTPPDNTTTNPPDNTANNTIPPDNTNKQPENTVTTTPPPSTGVSYRVQICASHSTVGSAYFQGRYGITESIKIENHEGWVKYTVGSFREYKEARDHRENVKGKGVYDAFVTAYNEGKRITVQEALMISKQQWFR